MPRSPRAAFSGARPSLARPFALSAIAMACAWSAHAQTPPLPVGAQVRAGQATIGQQGTTMTIRQGSDKLITDWQRFDIGAGHRVQFVQPSADAVALNRVVGNDASLIQGALQSNGKVFLVNPNGVLFAPSARVDVGGLVASTLALTDDDFLAGRYSMAGSSSASVVNQGTLRAAGGGAVALVAARVVNSGRIEADGGQVLLGAGRRVTLDFGGPVQLRVDEAALDALVDQGGAIRADGGVVYLAAKAAEDLSARVIAHGGVTEARGIAAGPAGQVFLVGEGGIAEAGGTIDVASAGGHGGRVVVSADRVLVDGSARIDASGAAGGGLLQIGGGWQGQDAGVRNAQDVIVRDGAALAADAVRQGDGGTVVVWADHGTQFAGRITARGGARGGNGGAVEVSGKQRLGFTGSVDTSAPLGTAGKLLLDPNTLTIVDGSAGQTGTAADWGDQADVGTYTIPETVLEAMTGNVVLTAVTDIIINNLSDNVLNLSATNISFLANDESGPSSSGGFTMRDRHDTIRLNQGAGSTLTIQGGFVSSANTAGNSNAATSGASVVVGNIETQGAAVVFNTKRSSAAGPMVVYGTISTSGGDISVTPGTRFGLTNSSQVNVQFVGAVDTGGGNFASNMTGTVKIDGGLDLGHGTATFGGTGTQINSLVNSTNDIAISAPLSFGAGAAIQTSGTITFGNTASMLPGGDLTLTASNFAFNSSFTGNNANITLRPYDPSTNVDVGSAGTGGMLISNAALSSLAGFRNITIGRSDATGTTRVTTDATVAASGQLELVNRRIDIVDGTLANTAGNIVLTGNQVTIGKSVTAAGGNGGLAIRPLDPSAPMQLAVSPAAALGGDLLELGSASGGDLLLTDDVATTASTVILRSAGSITAAQGGISAANIAAEAGGAVTLTDDSFDFTTLALRAGADSHARSSRAFEVGTVDGLAGATVTGKLTLESTAAGTVTASRAINADAVLLRGATAGFDLSGAVHHTGTLAADVGGALRWSNDGALTVGSTQGTAGVHAGGAVALATRSGDLTLAEGITTTAVGSDAIRLVAGENATAGTAAGGDIVVAAPGVALVTGAGGRATLYTGSLAGSTGVAERVGLGSGRFRYASDEASAGYDTVGAALGDGVYAVYREQPLLTPSFAAQTLVYGDAPAAWQFTVAGLHNGDSAAQALAGSAGFATGGLPHSSSGRVAAGTHSVAYDGGLASPLGYAIDPGTTTTLTVTPRPVALEGLAIATRPYDGTLDAAFAATPTAAVLAGDAVTVAGTSGLRYLGADAGTNKAVVPSGLALVGADAANYLLADPGHITGTVTPRAITVQIDPAGKVYGDADPTFAYRIADGSLVGDERLGLTLTRAAGENAGRYAIDVATGGNPNYAVTAEPGTLTITPRPLTVRVADASKVYGTADPAFAWQAGSGFAEGDTLALTLKRTAGEGVGRYAIELATSVSPNYAVSVEPGTFFITPAMQTHLVSGQVSTLTGLSIGEPLGQPRTANAAPPGAPEASAERPADGNVPVPAAFAGVQVLRGGIRLPDGAR